MDIPLELSFHNMAPSDSLKAAVRQQVDRLERFCGHIIGCRVVIEMPHKSHRLGSNAPDVHVLLRVPGREIVVSRERARERKAPANAYAVLRDAFQAVQQRLKDYRRQQQGEVKPKAAPLLGHVVELVAERKYGFLATADNQEFYFHRNAVADGGFDQLRVGDPVEYAPVLGDQTAARVWRTGARNQDESIAEENLARTQDSF